jgi:hypothetical protein
MTTTDQPDGASVAGDEREHEVEWIGHPCWCRETKDAIAAAGREGSD